MLRDQFSLDLESEIFVDNFAGGGGASTGIEMAIGRHVAAALNHNKKALSMHRINHPQTVHYQEDIRTADPVKIAAGRRIGGAWFSPDCTHFTKARNGKPKNKKIRGLAWSVINWINKLSPFGNAPRVIFLENVEEFQSWCPLLPDGTLNKWRAGWFFRCFTGALLRRGYSNVEWAPGDGFVYRRTHSCIERVVDVAFTARACDYSAPTIRKRLYLIARRDGQPIVWPAATHADPSKPSLATAKLKPYRTIAECLDFTLRCPSIFLSKADAKVIKAIRPLAPATLARIAKGVDRYVIKTKNPFLVSLTHQGGDRCESITEPSKTITAANRGEKALIAPVLAGHRSKQVPASETTRSAIHVTKFRTGSVGCAAGDPSPTITANSFVKRPGGAAPLGIVAASIVKMRGENVGHSANEPVHTISAQGTHHGVIAAYIAQHNGGSTGHQSIGHPATAPASTISSKGSQQQLVAASLIKYNGTDQDPKIDEPSHTITTRDRLGVAEAQLEATVLTKDQEAGARRVAAFLRQQGIHFEGEYATVDGRVIVDIGMRMLKPRELYRAQGFPENYIIDRGMDINASGQLEVIPLKGTDQVRMCGNSVSPPMSCALVGANLPEMQVARKAA